jgi:hypothetical protein
MVDSAYSGFLQPVPVVKWIIRYCEVCVLIPTVSKLDDDRVLTQYLFHNRSRSFLSRDDLKYDTSKE